MAHLFGAARLGRDAEIRTVGGDSVCNLSLAFSYYSKSAEGGRATQWVDAALWGKRAEVLAPMLRKGSVHTFTLEDVHIEEYQSSKGAGHKLVGRVISVELGARADSAPSPAPAPRSAPAPRPAAPAPKQGLDDMLDDVPF